MNPRLVGRCQSREGVAPVKDAVLVDSDVFSFTLKQDSRRLLYAEDLRDRRLAISVMTVAEVRRWPLERKWGAAKLALLTATLSRHLVLPLDELTAEHWARIYVNRARRGRPILPGDCWIAATAVRYDVPLVSHNAGDYAFSEGLKLITHAPSSGA